MTAHESKQPPSGPKGPARMGAGIGDGVALGIAIGAAFNRAGRRH